MIIKTADKLHQLAKEILMAAGADERNAEGVAEHLVLSNLSGVDTHGVWHLPGYVTAIEAGEIVPTAWPDILRETPATALVTGNWTFGQVAAKVAMEVAISKAQELGMAVVGLVQCHHIGRLGHVGMWIVGTVPVLAARPHQPAEDQSHSGIGRLHHGNSSFIRQHTARALISETTIRSSECAALRR